MCLHFVSLSVLVIHGLFQYGSAFSSSQDVMPSHMRQYNVMQIGSPDLPAIIATPDFDEEKSFLAKNTRIAARPTHNFVAGGLLGFSPLTPRYVFSFFTILLSIGIV